LVIVKRQMKNFLYDRNIFVVVLSYGTVIDIVHIFPTCMDVDVLEIYFIFSSFSCITEWSEPVFSDYLLMFSFYRTAFCYVMALS
jgi:hypothetical protein